MDETGDLTPIVTAPIGVPNATTPLPTAAPTPAESLLLAAILVAAFHAIPYWLIRFLPVRELYEQLGANAYGTLYDALSGVMPLLLCIGVPIRSGLTIGHWDGKALKVVGVCVLPIILTGLIYPLTSRPFSGQRIGSWLVSPAAQDLLFAGYLYGVFDVTFPVNVHKKCRVRLAVIITAFFFALWHIPNFRSIPATYVAFQLFYTFIGCAWMLLTRQLTGSIVPGLVTHMACNFIAWL